MRSRLASAVLVAIAACGGARGNGALTVAKRTGDSFLDSTSDCCHATALGIRRDPDTLRVVLASDGPARDCFGGTAAVDQFEIYAFDGASFTLEQSLAVGMH